MRATSARHTWPDAIGFLIDVERLRLWHSGDTEYEHLRALAAVRPRTVVPMHYGLWAAKDYHYGGAAPDEAPDPSLFEATLSRLSTRIRISQLDVGRNVTLS